MALTVTAADVRPLPGAIVRRFTAGAAIDVGAPVYVASDGYVEEADADAAASCVCVGICVASNPNAASQTAVAEGEECDVVVLGPVTGFSGMTPGTYAFVSTTAGGLEATAPAGSSSDYVGVVGIIISATEILVNPFTYDVAAQ